MNPEVGETIKYHGYPISHPIKEDFITEIAHNSLEDAKEFIDRLLKLGLLDNVEAKEVKP